MCCFNLSLIVVVLRKNKESAVVDHWKLFISLRLRKINNENNDAHSHSSLELGVGGVVEQVLQAQGLHLRHQRLVLSHHLLVDLSGAESRSRGHRGSRGSGLSELSGTRSSSTSIVGGSGRRNANRAVVRAAVRAVVGALKRALD